MGVNMGVLFVILANFFCFSLVVDATVINVRNFKNENKQGAEIEHSLKRISKFDIEKFLKQYGYPFEKHPITTEDGYKLELHRIPSGKADIRSPERPVVLLMHDFLGTSADFVISGPANSLALQLVEQGYDVWLGNNRGNTWSRSHQTIDPSNKTFWDFSFHELGVYDLPATIDYILDRTGQYNLSYVGYSQGATQFFVMLSEKPEYNKNITIMTALAPLVFVQNVSHPIFRLFSKYVYLVEFAEKFVNISEVLSHDSLITLAGSLVCRETSKFRGVCSLIASLFLGIDQDHIDAAMIPNLLSIYPGGASLKGFKHYAKAISSVGFRQYDYGKIYNLQKYKSPEPPAYDLAKIKVPIALFYSKKDWLAHVTNVHQLAEILPNVELNHTVENDKFNHGDFLYSGAASSVLNFYVINSLNKRNGMEEITSPIPTSTTTQSSVSPGSTSTRTDSTTPRTDSTTSRMDSTTPSIPSTTPSGSFSDRISSSSLLVFVHLLLAGSFATMITYY